jgi:hypothetical protein
LPNQYDFFEIIVSFDIRAIVVAGVVYITTKRHKTYNRED